MNNSTFSGNSVIAGPSSLGGGIYIGGGTLNVSNSTFSGNSSNTGGGLDNFGSNVTISNSSFSGNNTSLTGGGIAHTGGTMLVTNSTIFGNSASTGGGFYSFNLNNPLTLRNTIIANNLTGGNCSGPLIDGGNNLQFPANSCGATILSNDPQLGTLANNGGPTQTLALTPGSPAIDAANPAFCPATDQRGFSRFNICDIGAFEFVPGSGPGPTAISIRPPADLIAWLRETPDRIADNNPENLITFTYTLKNVGVGTASALRIEFPIDPQLAIGFAQSDNPQVWVSSVSTQTVTINMPNLDKNQEVTGRVTFRPVSNPSPPPGTKLLLRYALGYDDPAGTGKKQLSNAVAFAFGEPGSNWDVSGGAIQLMETTNPSVSAGSKTTFSCDCYIPNEAVNAWLTRPDGTSVALNGGTADKNGLFSITVDTGGLEAGTYVVAAFGNRSEITGSGVLTIVQS